jgi:hypothetical protein
MTRQEKPRMKLIYIAHPYPEVCKFREVDNGRV